MVIRTFLHPQPPGATFASFPDVAIYMRRLWDSMFRMRQGKLECVAELTLAANAATTVFTDLRLSLQSVLIFDPKTANAATELGNGTMYTLTANRGGDFWTITHANNVQTDRTFQVAIIG